MNTVEGFFGVGAIIGPIIVVELLAADVSWKWLYVIAGTICMLLIVTALLVRYPKTVKTADEAIDFKRKIPVNSFFSVSLSVNSSVISVSPW